MNKTYPRRMPVFAAAALGTAMLLAAAPLFAQQAEQASEAPQDQQAAQDQKPAGAAQDQEPAGAAQDQEPAGAAQDQEPAGAAQDQKPGEEPQARQAEDGRTLEEILSGQPPLTAEDVPAAIALITAVSGPDGPQAVAVAAAKHGLTRDRATYLVAKFLAGLKILSSPPVSPDSVELPFWSSAAVPSFDELEVIKANADELLLILSHAKAQAGGPSEAP
ncbi:MAG: hypothetical protein LBW85_10410 [Deltaproteobacteria bacterium]|jgi:hypothetical protein|nr:hypothetical protein [Deltaproteobacteria bacterium]